MSIPTGYEKLAVIGIAWKNEYVQGTAYKTMNSVYYNGSTYGRCGTTHRSAGRGWCQLAVSGQGIRAAVTVCYHGLRHQRSAGAGWGNCGGQALMDAIADKVMTKLIAKSQIVNNLLATEPGNVLDATQGRR